MIAAGAEIGSALADWGKEYAEKAGSKIKPTYARPGSATDITAQAAEKTGDGVLDLAALPATQGLLIKGRFYGDGSGLSASTAGDLDGEGLDDILIGAHRSSAGGELRRRLSFAHRRRRGRGG